MKNDEEYAPLWEHVEALRNTLVKVIATIFISFLVAFYFYPTLIHLLTTNLPSKDAELSLLQTERVEQLRITNHSHKTQNYQLPPGAKLISASLQNEQGLLQLPPQESAEFTYPVAPKKLLILSPPEGLITAMKVSFWVGLVISSPFWLYLLMTFIAPALHAGEKMILAPFLTMSLLFFSAGLAFSYYLTLPLANGYFALFNEQIGQNAWTLAHYLDYTLIIMISNGLAFEAAVILFILVHYRLINSEQLIHMRRPVIVGAFILGALLTPPDILTQVMLAVPLILIYEAMILYAKLIYTPPLEIQTTH